MRPSETCARGQHAGCLVACGCPCHQDPRRLEAMLAELQQQNAYLVAALDRVEGLSRLLRHRGTSFAGTHVADLIDRAVTRVGE